MVYGLHCKVHSHEFNDRNQPHKGGSDGNTCKACLCDGSIPESLRSVLIDESFSNFIGPVVVGDFFSDDEDVGISGEFLVKSPIECFSVSDFL